MMGGVVIAAVTNSMGLILQKGDSSAGFFDSQVFQSSTNPLSLFSLFLFMIHSLIQRYFPRNPLYIYQSDLVIKESMQTIIKQTQGMHSRFRGFNSSPTKPIPTTYFSPDWGKTNTPESTKTQASDSQTKFFPANTKSIPSLPKHCHHRSTQINFSKPTSQQNINKTLNNNHQNGNQNHRLTDGGEMDQIKTLLQRFKTKLSNIQKKYAINTQPQPQYINAGLRPVECSESSSKINFKVRPPRHSQFTPVTHNQFHQKQVEVPSKSSTKASIRTRADTDQEPLRTVPQKLKFSTPYQRSVIKKQSVGNKINNVSEDRPGDLSKQPRFSLQPTLGKRLLGSLKGNDMTILSENGDNEDDAESVVVGTFFDQFPKLYRRDTYQKQMETLLTEEIRSEMAIPFHKEQPYNNFQQGVQRH